MITQDPAAEFRLEARLRAVAYGLHLEDEDLRRSPLFRYVRQLLHQQSEGALDYIANAPVGCWFERFRERRAVGILCKCWGAPAVAHAIREAAREIISGAG